MAKIIATVFGLAVVGLGSFAAYQFFTTPDYSEPSACSVQRNITTEEAKPSCCQSINRTSLVTEVPACCSVNEATKTISEPEVLTVAPREVK